MIRLQDLSQERLALFIVDREGRRPLRKVPVYAELVLGALPGERAAPARPRSRVLDEIARAVPEAASQVAEAIAGAVDAEWIRDNANGAAMDRLVKQIAETLDGQGLLDPEVDRAEREAAIRENLDLLLLRYEIPRAQKREAVDVQERVVPLGVLASDHTGFVSFDLARIRPWREALGGEAAGGLGVDFRVYPMLLDAMRVDVLTQRRVAPDAVVGKLELTMDADAPLPGFALNLPAIQNPGLIDWRLSPGSFAAVPQTLIGTDGCETLTPANFATSQFHMRQVVRLNQKVDGTQLPECYVNEYVVSMIPIGHSLGQVLYSLPLAPGETVRLAVIDWRRQDTGKRDEKTVVTESLVHEQTRDRTITETVTAALAEWQRGGSVMGGAAAGAGASGEMGPFSVVGGGMLSVGGGYATSSGNRDLAADTVQKVTDAIHQSSTSVREMQSTVVVQTDQQERQNIMTRAFANHNRGHTLTVLYYEVLRHFRVVTEFTRRTRAVLLNGTAWDLGDDLTLLNWRYVLQAALLDPTLAPAFDALLRIDKLRKEQARNPPKAVQPPGEGQIEFNRFSVFFKVGNNSTTNALDLRMVLKNGVTIPLRYGGSTNWNKAEQFNQENSEFTIISDPLPTTYKWSEIGSFLFIKTSDAYDDSVLVYHLEIEGIGASGRRTVHPHEMGATYYLNDEGDSYPLPVAAPPPNPAQIVPPSFTQSLPLEDHALAERLKEHMKANAAYYARLLDLAQHPNAYARRFETEVWSAPTVMIDKVAPTPLEIMGSKVAFPLLDQEEETDLGVKPVERLISLPTRGVFAEAKLGHCNVAEEIDETRFWRWDEHPLPFFASDIGPVQPITPTPQQMNLGATPLPNPVATVQAAPAAPDPGAMAAALKLMATPDIFRDMSMKEEVSKLLEDLIKGVVDMTGAANRAKEIKSKLDTDLDAQQREQAVALAETEAGVRRAQIEAERDKAIAEREKQQQVTPAEAQHATKVAEAQARKGNISPETAKTVAENQVRNMKGSTKPAPKVRTREFEIRLFGHGGKAIVGQFAWELRRGKRTITFRPKERYDNGRIEFTVMDDGLVPNLALQIEGEVLAGYAVGATFNQENLDIDIPEKLWKDSDYIRVTLQATTATFKTKATSGSEASKNFTDEVKGGVGLDKIISITGEGGVKWEKGDKTSTGREMEMEVLYYLGGFTVTKIS